MLKACDGSRLGYTKQHLNCKVLTEGVDDLSRLHHFDEGKLDIW